MSNFLSIEQKKGDSQTPHGKLTVYARVTVEQSKESQDTHSQLYDILRSGFLVAQGNYRDQNNLRDFLQQELGTSFDDEEGIKSFVENLGGIEGALDPDKFKEKLEELEELEEFIPTPAKMVHFSSEAEILREEGDIFYLGVFENSANANLAVNAATILYQAQYRERQILTVRNEVDSLIDQLELPPEDPEQNAPKVIHKKSIPQVEISLEGELLSTYIPRLLHSVEDPHERENAEKDLQSFLDWYKHPEDIERILSLTGEEHFGKDRSELIALYVKKIVALKEEDFSTLPAIVAEIKRLESELHNTL